MTNLLCAEWYKLFHSRYFWTIGAFNLFLSSILLLDSAGETSSLFFASLYNTPILYFLLIIFAALFIGSDFEQRTLQSYISAGHQRGQVWAVKILVYLAACVAIVFFPLLVHGAIGGFVLQETLTGAAEWFVCCLLMVLAICAMCLLPAFFAFVFRDVGKTLVIPLALFFLMMFLLNGKQAAVFSQILPIGQLRLIALEELPSQVLPVVLVDVMWVMVCCAGAYVVFRRFDLH